MNKMAKWGYFAGFVVVSAIMVLTLVFPMGQSKRARVMSKEERVTLNYMASLKGVRSVVFGDTAHYREKQTWPLSDVRLPDYKYAQRAVTVKFTDGSRITDVVNWPDDLQEYVGTDWDWQQKGLKTSLTSFEPATGDGDDFLIIKGKSYDFDEAIGSDSAAAKTINRWQRQHLGKTRSKVTYSAASGVKKQVVMTTAMLKQYRHWEHKQDQENDSTKW